ncbi:MAG: hypothetical protein J6K32_02550 [Clostridia bacterium]|nr:hypothetical protein [Clostridia bacterium]
MAYKQPRPPQPGGSTQAYIAALTRFLRDFCHAAWDADRRKDAQIRRILKRLDALDGGEE